MPSCTPRRRHFGVLTAAILASSAAVCAPAAARELRVVASIKPIHSLVAQVMQGIGVPALLVDGAASPHSFALKPSDARALNGADVVFRVAPTLEPFTVKIAEALPASVKLVTLENAEGVELLDTRTAATFDGHGHADHADRHAGHDDHDDEHAHGGKDGHIWLDPANARAIVRAVASELAAHAPELKPKLDANAASALAAIDALDRELAAILAPAAGKPFVVFHDAYQYLERRYGLSAAGSITVNPEVKPSARRLSAIRRKVAELGAACIFAEPQFSPKIVATVAEGSAARSGILDPIGTDIASGPGLYSALMQKLARSLADCVGGRS
jgi:zinc transport system substrate-binding protein